MSFSNQFEMLGNFNSFFSINNPTQYKNNNITIILLNLRRFYTQYGYYNSILEEVKKLFVVHIV